MWWLYWQQSVKLEWILRKNPEFHFFTIFIPGCPTITALFACSNKTWGEKLWKEDHMFLSLPAPSLIFIHWERQSEGWCFERLAEHRISLQVYSLNMWRLGWSKQVCGRSGAYTSFSHVCFEHLNKPTITLSCVSYSEITCPSGTRC